MGVAICSSAATAPARCVGPSMMTASSWSTPSSFGRAPTPTDITSGSSSAVLMPFSTASSRLPPLASTSAAFSFAGFPCFQVEMKNGLPAAASA